MRAIHSNNLSFFEIENRFYLLPYTLAQSSSYYNSFFENCEEYLGRLLFNEPSPLTTPPPLPNIHCRR